MRYLSLKGIMAGCISWVVLVGLGLALINFVIGPWLTTGSLLAYTALWIIPGFVAAMIAGRLGLLHGAVVGIIVGSFSKLILSYLYGPIEAGVAREIDVSAQSMYAAAIWCTLGGGLWDAKHFVSRK